MKKIVYTIDWQLHVCVPTEGSRLAHGVKLKSGEVLRAPKPQQVDRFLRLWPVDGAVADWAETEDEFVARIAAKDVPTNAANTLITDAASIPTDRTFRNAWKLGISGVEIDMPMAREIKREHLRVLRKPKIDALDVDYMRADERGDIAEEQRIAILKQALRDVTANPAIEAAKTPEELKTVIPDALL